METKIVVKNFWKTETYREMGFCPIIYYTCPKCGYTNQFTMRFGKTNFPTTCPKCSKKNIKKYRMEYTMEEMKTEN